MTLLSLLRISGKVTVEVSSHCKARLISFFPQHYTDGDTVNNKTPVGYGPAGDESLAVWGPDVPHDFLE